MFRFALRRALGKALKNDIDVEQLDVALGAGTLELRDLVLDCDYLTRQLGHESLRVEEGRVGWVRATIPWNALGTKSCVVEIGDVDLVVTPRDDSPPRRPGTPRARRHRRRGARGADATRDANANGSPNGASNPRANIVDDGVRLISKALENVLKGLEAHAVDVTVRIDALSHRTRTASTSTPAPLILARFKTLDFRDDAVDGGVAATREKVVSIDGLEVDVTDDVRGEPGWRRAVGGDGDEGLNCVAAAKWSWRSEDAAASFEAPDAIAASLTLSPAWVKASPEVLAACTRVAYAFQHGKSSVEEDEVEGANEEDEEDEFVSPESSFIAGICEDADSSEEEGMEQVREGMRAHMSQYLDRHATGYAGEDSDDDDEDDEETTELTMTVACPSVTATALYDETDEDEGCGRYPSVEHVCVDAVGIAAVVSVSAVDGVSCGVRIDGLDAREYLAAVSPAARALAWLPPDMYAPFEPTRRGNLHRAPLLTLDAKAVGHDVTNIGAATLEWRRPGGRGAEPSSYTAALAPCLTWLDAGFFDRLNRLTGACVRTHADGDGATEDDDGVGPVSGGTQITVNAARIRVVVCAAERGAGDGSTNESQRPLVRCAALDIVHDASPDAAPALTVSVPPNDDDANALSLEFSDVVHAAFHTPPHDVDRSDGDDLDEPLIVLESGDTGNVSVAIASKGGGFELTLGSEGSDGLDTDAYHAARRRADDGVNATSPCANEDAERVDKITSAATDAAYVEIGVSAHRIALAASPGAAARASGAAAAFASLPRGNPLSCAPLPLGEPAIPVAFRASADTVSFGIQKDLDTRTAPSTMDGSSSSVMMHSAASAMFQSAMSFLKESTHGSSSTSVEGAQRDGSHARRGAGLLLRNAELFSASAMCGKVGADLLTVNAEGFDLTRTDADGGDGECVLTARDHEALTGTPGLTVVHARAPGVGGAVCVSISGAVGKLVRGDWARACRGAEGVLGDIGETMADISAAAAASATAADADDESAAADPYYAHLDVRESAVQLVGATKGDADEVTSHRGVLRVDSLRVAVVPGESDAETTVIPNTHTHPASSGPSLKHSARIEGIAVHVAPPTALAAATDVDAANLPGFPCTRRALEAANMPAVARESEVRVEAHTGGGRATLVALRSTSLRCDFQGDSLNAAADLLDAMSHHSSSDDSPDEEETQTLSSFESSPPRRRLDNAPAAAAALSPPSVRVAAGHTVLDTVDEAAFTTGHGDGSFGRAKSPLFGGVIEDYASVSNGTDRKARERTNDQRLRSSRYTPPRSPPPLTIAEQPGAPTTAFNKSYADAVSTPIWYVSPETAATEAMRAMRLSQSQTLMGRSGAMMGSYMGSHVMGSGHLMHGSAGLPPRPPRSPKPTGAPKAAMRRRTNGADHPADREPSFLESREPTVGKPKPTEHRAVWFDGGAGISVIDDHVSVPSGSCVTPGTHPSLPQPPRDGSSPTGTVTASVARFEVNARSGRAWGSSPGSSSGSSPSSSDAECAGVRFVVKGAALRCDELAAGPVAWRAVAAVTDAACMDLTPPPRCQWRKILAHDPKVERETDVAMLRAEISAVRMDPDGASDATELRLRAALLPLHLRLDQHAVRFFQAFGARGGAERAETESGDDYSDSEDFNADGGSISDGDAVETAASAAYFQLVEIRAPSIRLDYVPRDVDVAALRAGNLAEALNLVPFGGVAVHLRPVTLRGVCGWSRLTELVVRSWLEHIATTQAHTFARGLAPIRSVCNVGAATKGLVTTPLEFRRSGRRGGAWRGAAHGAATFVKAVSREALGLGVNIAAATNAVIGGVEDAVVRRRGEREEMPEPGTLREGVRQAATTLGRGLKKAASAVKDGPVRVHRQGGDGTAVMVSAVRTAPTATVAPVAAAAEAVHRTLLGARNQFASANGGASRGVDATREYDDTDEVDVL